MPPLRGGRPLKRWRYLGLYGPELMLCAGVVRIGLLPQVFWAVWDPRAGRLRERTRFVRPVVALGEQRARIADGDVELDLALDARAPIEAFNPHGREYAWTRKLGDVRARGTVRLGRARRRVDLRGIVDESAGYHARETAWRWSAGVGTDAGGRPVAWNLVDGIHDGPAHSERTVWVDGVAHEVGPVTFAGDLSRVGGGALDLTFAGQSERRRDDDLLLFRSSYAQPFGTFSGRLGDDLALAEGYGVMERHDVRW